MLSKFDLHDISFAISTRPEKYMGSDALWETATKALTDALVTSNAKYTIKEGEGAGTDQRSRWLSKTLWAENGSAELSK